MIPDVMHDILGVLSLELKLMLKVCAHYGIIFKLAHKKDQLGTKIIIKCFLKASLLLLGHWKKLSHCNEVLILAQ